MREKLAKTENLARGVHRYIKQDLDPVTSIDTPSTKRLALFLIHKITDRSW